MATPAPFVAPFYLSDAGAPLAAGLLYTYEAGTSTPKATYQDAAGTIANTNPVVLDGAGRAAIYLGEGAYKFVLMSAEGETLWTRDDVQNAGIIGSLQVLDSVASLRALPGGSSTYVEIMGYYEGGDGGGGIFRWDSSSTAADDAGVVIRPSSLPATGRWIRVFSGPVNVRWYGALGDGSTSDSAALAGAGAYCQAQTNGGTVYFPPCDLYYRLTANFTAGTRTKCRFDRGSRIDGAFTATFNAGVDADQGVGRIFGSSLTLAFARGSLVEFYPQWVGMVQDGSTDDKVALELAASICHSNNVKLKIPSGTVRLSSLNLNGLTGGLIIEGVSQQSRFLFGAAVTDAYGTYCFRIDGGCRKVILRDLQLNFPTDETQDCLQIGTSAGTSQAYECSFYNVLFQGNSSSDKQSGIVVENAYIHQFYNCQVFNFGRNIVFEAEANSCNFYGCSIRANQSSNVYLVDARSGQWNTFVGGDIENCNAICKNTGCEGLVFDDVYMEASFNPAFELYGGYTMIERCFLSEFRCLIDSDGRSEWRANRIRKTGSSFFIKHISSTIPYFVFEHNRIEPSAGSPSTTGLMLRAFETGIQYWSGSYPDYSTPAGNATISEFLSIDSDGIYNVNTAAKETIRLSAANSQRIAGDYYGRRIILNQSTGTSPLSVSSTTLVSNLNADLLDGLNSTDFMRRSQVSATLTGGAGWYRFASNGTVSGGSSNSNRASARFCIRDSTGSRHAAIWFTVSAYFGKRPIITVDHMSTWDFFSIEQIRVVYSDVTSEGFAVEFYTNRGTSDDIAIIMWNNESTVGWSLSSPAAGSVPGGYTSMAVNLVASPVMAVSAYGKADIFALRTDGRLVGAAVPTATVPAIRHTALFKIAGVNLNSAATDTGTFTGLPSKYRIIRLTAFDASISLTTATFDLRTAAAGAGTALVSAFAPSALTSAAKYVDATLAAAATTDYQTAGTLYLRNVTAQGAAATASFLLEIEDLS